MIRKINTDQLFIKRTESYAKLKSNKIYNSKELRTIQPIRNIMSESTPMKAPNNRLPIYANALSDL
jgi:hypothetical protein